MYGILLSALRDICAWVFTKVIVKFVILWALYWIIQTFVAVLGGFIPNPSTLTSAFGGLASGIWYFMDLFAFSQGASMVVAAFATRFLIRRIPLIG